MRKIVSLNQKMDTGKPKKVYQTPLINVYALACTDGMLVTGSVTGGGGIGNGGNVSEQEETPIMDVKGDWQDIWD